MVCYNKASHYLRNPDFNMPYALIPLPFSGNKQPHQLKCIRQSLSLCREGVRGGSLFPVRLNRVWFIFLAAFREFCMDNTCCGWLVYGRSFRLFQLKRAHSSRTLGGSLPFSWLNHYSFGFINFSHSCTKTPISSKRIGATSWGVLSTQQPFAKINHLLALVAYQLSFLGR